MRHPPDGTLGLKRDPRRTLTVAAYPAHKDLAKDWLSRFVQWRNATRSRFQHVVNPSSIGTEEPSRFHWHSSSDSHRRTAFYCHKDTLFPNSPNCRASSPQLRPSAPFDELPEFEADSLSEAVRGVTFPVCGLVFLDGSRRSASSIASLRGGSVSPLTLSGVRRVEGKDIFCDLAAELPVRGGCRWWSDRAT